jgi:hypothetical protein
MFKIIDKLLIDNNQPLFHHGHMDEQYTVPSQTSSTSNLPSSRSAMGWKIGVSVLTITSLAFMATTGWMYKLNLDANSQNSSLSDQLDTANAASTPTLPAAAVRLSGCVPFMGEHWADPKEVPNGITYLVYNNKVIGIEYMYKLDTIPGIDTSKMTQAQFQQYMKDNKLSYADALRKNTKYTDINGYKIQEYVLAYSAPHPGMPVPHEDIHMYFVNQDFLKTVCPNNTPDKISTPDVIKNIKDYNIPVPGGSSSATPSAILKG